MSYPKVRVKRSSAGLGLFADEPIKKGTQVIEYTGEWISHEEGDRRGGKYLFTLNDDWIIDGKDRDNIARYVNHACTPNCEAVNYDDEKVIYEALRSIAAGEELTVDYGEEYVEEHITPVGCKCASCLSQ